jgi:hypothetical protein
VSFWYLLQSPWQVRFLGGDFIIFRPKVRGRDCILRNFCHWVFTILKIHFLFTIELYNVHTWTKNIKFLFRKWALFMFTLGPRKLKFLFCKWALFMFTLWTHVVPALFLNPSTQASKAGTTWVQITVQNPVSYVEGKKKKKTDQKKKPPSLPVFEIPYYFPRPPPVTPS